MKHEDYAEIQKHIVLIEKSGFMRGKLILEFKKNKKGMLIYVKPRIIMENEEKKPKNN